MLKFSALLIATLALTGPAYAKDKNSSMEDRVRGEFSEDNHQGKGKPDNPGEHGRDNAAQKQRENPGKGSKGGDSWEESIRNESGDKSKDKNKDKNKNKDKEHNKKGNKK